MRDRSNAVMFDADLIAAIQQVDTDTSQHMTRAQRDALRSHAQQILACLTSPQEGEQDPAVLSYLLTELKEAADRMASDYAENNERAFHQKEYDKWKKIAEVSEQELERVAAFQNQFGALGHHAMGRGIATHLLSDMSNLSYVLAMNVASILKTTSTLVPALSGAASSISGVAGTINGVQPFVGIGLYSALLVFDTACIAKHNYQREVEKDKKKKEQSYTKFLEHGRWMNWMNAGAWITAGVLATMSFATPIIIISAMASAILVTSMARIVHQAVEVNKLKDVRKSYIEQLADEAIEPEKRVALTMLVSKATHAIGVKQGKLIATSVLTTATLSGIGLTAAAIAIGAVSAAFTPLLIIGAALLLIAGIVTIITNRQAIAAAFKAIFKQVGKKAAAPHEPRAAEDNSCSDDDFDMLSTCPEPDPELDELNREMSHLWEGCSEEKGMEPEEIEAQRSVDSEIRYSNRVPENLRTKRALSSLARVHRPPTGNAQDVVAAIDKHSSEKRLEAFQESKNDEREVI